MISSRGVETNVTSRHVTSTHVTSRYVMSREVTVVIRCNAMLRTPSSRVRSAMLSTTCYIVSRGPCDQSRGEGGADDALYNVFSVVVA